MSSAIPEPDSPFPEGSVMIPSSTRTSHTRRLASDNDLTTRWTTPVPRGRQLRPDLHGNGSTACLRRRAESREAPLGPIRWGTGISLAGGGEGHLQRVSLWNRERGTEDNCTGNKAGLHCIASEKKIVRFGFKTKLKKL